MSLFVVISTGCIIGLLLGASIFFERKEPYKREIMVASTIRNTLVSLLTGFSLSAHSAWYTGIGFGMLYGILSGLVVFLPRGGCKSKDARYVVPGAAIAGGLTDVVIVNYTFS